MDELIDQFPLERGEAIEAHTASGLIRFGEPEIGEIPCIFPA